MCGLSCRLVSPVHLYPHITYSTHFIIDCINIVVCSNKKKKICEAFNYFSYNLKPVFISFLI